MSTETDWRPLRPSARSYIYIYIYIEREREYTHVNTKPILVNISFHSILHVVLVYYMIV